VETVRSSVMPHLKKGSKSRIHHDLGVSLVGSRKLQKSIGESGNDIENCPYVPVDSFTTMLKCFLQSIIASIV
jgi:hypothetical protein